jgi:hypothetical protein
MILPGNVPARFQRFATYCKDLPEMANQPEAERHVTGTRDAVTCENSSC